MAQNGSYIAGRQIVKKVEVPPPTEGTAPLDKDEVRQDNILEGQTLGNSALAMVRSLPTVKEQNTLSTKPEEIANPNKVYPKAVQKNYSQEYRPWLVTRAIDWGISLPSKFIDYLEIRELRSQQATWGGLIADFFRGRIFNDNYTGLPEEVRSYHFEDPLSKLPIHRDTFFWIRKLSKSENPKRDYEDWKNNSIPALARQVDYGKSSRRELVTEKLNEIVDKAYELSRRPYRRELNNLIQHNRNLERLVEINPATWLHILGSCMTNGHRLDLLRSEIHSELMQDTLRPGQESYLWIKDKEKVKENIEIAVQFLQNDQDRFDSYERDSLLSLIGMDHPKREAIESFVLGLPEKITPSNIAEINCRPEADVFSAVLESFGNHPEYYSLLLKISENINLEKNALVRSLLETKNGSWGERCENTTSSDLFSIIVSPLDSGQKTFSELQYLDVFVEYTKTHESDERLELFYARSAIEEIIGALKITEALRSKDSNLKTIEELTDYCVSKDIPLGSILRWINEDSYYGNGDLAVQAREVVSSYFEELLLDIYDTKSRKQDYDLLHDICIDVMSDHAFAISNYEWIALMNIAESYGCEKKEFASELATAAEVNTILDVIQNPKDNPTFAFVEAWGLFGEDLLKNANNQYNSAQTAFNLHSNDLADLFTEENQFTRTFKKIIIANHGLSSSNIDQLLDKYALDQKNISSSEAFSRLLRHINKDHRFSPIVTHVAKKVGIAINPFYCWYRDSKQIDISSLKKLTTNQFIEKIPFNNAEKRPSFDLKKSLNSFINYLESEPRANLEILNYSKMILGVMQLREWKPDDNSLTLERIGAFSKKNGITNDATVRWYKETFGEEVSPQNFKNEEIIEKVLPVETILPEIKVVPITRKLVTRPIEGKPSNQEIELFIEVVKGCGLDVNDLSGFEFIKTIANFVSAKPSQSIQEADDCFQDLIDVLKKSTNCTEEQAKLTIAFSIKNVTESANFKEMPFASFFFQEIKSRTLA